MTLPPAAFDTLAGLLKSRSGLVLTKEKAYLLDSRLAPVLRKHELANLAELAAALNTWRDEALTAEVVEAMTNNETFFFRDMVPFDLLKTVMLPKLRTSRAAARTIRIWCAASSTGQEPYSIALTFAEAASQWAGWKIEITATDLSRRVLGRAEAGLYSQFEVQRGLPINLLIRHFAKEGDQWRISPDIRKMVRFRQLNLCSPFGALGQFDIIFCRNVLMYFDPATKGDILARMRRQMPADGYLVLGSAETVLGITDDFKPDWSHRGLYIPSDATGEKLAASA